MKRYPSLWTRLLLAALALVLLQGCHVFDWYPDGKDCRSKGCAAGQECKPVAGGDTQQYGCIPVPPAPDPGDGRI